MIIAAELYIEHCSCFFILLFVSSVASKVAPVADGGVFVDEEGNEVSGEGADEAQQQRPQIIGGSGGAVDTALNTLQEKTMETGLNRDYMYRSPLAGNQQGVHKQW